MVIEIPSQAIKDITEKLYYDKSLGWQEIYDIIEIGLHQYGFRVSNFYPEGEPE